MISECQFVDGQSTTASVDKIMGLKQEPFSFALFPFLSCAISHQAFLSRMYLNISNSKIPQYLEFFDLKAFDSRKEFVT